MQDWPVIGIDVLFGREEESENRLETGQLLRGLRGGLFGREFHGDHRLFPGNIS